MDQDRRSPNSRLQIDMTPDGAFRAPAGPAWSTRIIAVAVLVAAVAGAVAFAAFALWIALIMVPVVVLAVLIAVGTVRYRLWRARRAYGDGRSVRPQ